MDTSLLVSLSGPGARTLDGCAALADDLDTRGVPLSLLHTPGGSRRATEWVRLRVARGDAVALHGYDRRVPAEFASLRGHEAGLRLIAATAALDAEGLRTDVFAPPRWRITPEGREALRRHGFAVCADDAGVRDLRRGVTVRGRVHRVGVGERGGRERAGERLGTPAAAVRRGAARLPSWAARSVAMPAGDSGGIAAVMRAVRRGGLVRLAVDASDIVTAGGRRAVLDAVDAAVEAGARPRTYAALGATTSGVRESPTGVVATASARPAAAP
ncbi:DUF2334 domain-containing protein [Prauserella halophila]|uniref:DUF2334 domain-containing protein n=1 Tax=Prauserella halophila TaxID=185641 RepID=A0ABP4GY11_9PSEU|nr:DUF2334 domain-containing protein [Prauserella halophila]